MKLIKQTNPTGIKLRVKLMDSSSSTGDGITGLLFSSPGLVLSTIKEEESTTISYKQADNTIESITTIGAYETPTTNKCRFKEVDALNMPGVYEVHLSDSRLSSTKSMILAINGAPNLAQAEFEIQMDVIDSISSAIWNYALATMTLAGSIGKKLSDWVVGTIDTYIGNTKQTGDAYLSIDTKIPTSLSFTGANVNAESKVTAAPSDMALNSAVTALNDISSTDVQNAAAAALTAYDSPTKADLDSAVAPLAIETSVQEAITDIGGVPNAVWNSVLAELAAEPGAEPKTREAIMLLYMSLRNSETVTGSLKTIKNNAGSTISSATLSDDGTTFTKSKLA